jgi:hypothetical protein
MEWSALPSPVVGLERLARVMGTVTLSMLGMLIAHCGGYQMAQLVPGNRPSGPAPALAEAMHGGHAVLHTLLTPALVEALFSFSLISTD